jgi:ferredoxin
MTDKTLLQPQVPAQQVTTVTPPAVPGQPPKVVQSQQIGKYKVEVIREKCIAAASCVAIAPQVFELDEENIAKIISQDGNDDDTKLLAAQSCPTAAIIVTDTTTGQQVWPRG